MLTNLFGAAILNPVPNITAQPGHRKDLRMPKTPLPEKLSREHIAALTRAVREAAAWRGQLSGFPGAHEQRKEFDEYIALARQALRVVRRSARNPKGAP